MASCLRRLRRHPCQTLAAAAVLAASAYVLLAPLLAARYPAMTDLPFHAANASIIRHYWSKGWHFHEQFVLQPFRVPYMSMYLIAAALMGLMSAVSAIKVATAIMLGLLPAGLAVLFWGMRKSPLLGVTGLGFVWSALSGWGFVSFLGALGLFAMVVGLALRQLDRPSRAVGSCLAAALVVLFFTHPFRFPFAMAAVAGSALVMYPATRRWRPLLWPAAGPLVLFAVWWLIRPPALAGQLGPLRLHPERLAGASALLYGSFHDPSEGRAAAAAVWTLLVVAAILLVLAVRDKLRRPKEDARAGTLAWTIGAHGVVAACAGVFLLLFLLLPMQIGLWWYVYPREISSAAFIALALLPDLPRQRWWRTGCVLALCAAAVPLGRVVVNNTRRLDLATRDFTAIVKHIPSAPRLCYLVFDHRGSTAVHTPFIHLPAYVQAERGGWLSFHFASWGASPVVYRPVGEPGAVVPPATPLRWEWTPQRFRVLRDGAFFDWFLVRLRHDPSYLFRADATIEPVAHEGTWWLYRRRERR